MLRVCKFYKLDEKSLRLRTFAALSGLLRGLFRGSFHDFGHSSSLPSGIAST